MFKRFFRNRESNNSPEQWSFKLSLNAQKAIEILAKLEGSFTDQEVFGIFLNNNIDLDSAKKIIIFLPIAFCRQLLPTPAWKDEYYDNKGVLKKFSQTEPYMVIWQITASYFSNNPDRDVILKIGGRSAEFHVINDLLNAGGKLEEIELTPLHFG
jgi:hypothetical protein